MAPWAAARPAASRGPRLLGCLQLPNWGPGLLVASPTLMVPVYIPTVDRYVCSFPQLAALLAYRCPPARSLARPQCIPTVDRSVCSFPQLIATFAHSHSWLLCLHTAARACLLARPRCIPMVDRSVCSFPWSVTLHAYRHPPACLLSLPASPSATLSCSLLPVCPTAGLFTLPISYQVAHRITIGC
jgi:hypothetical protein